MFKRYQTRARSEILMGRLLGKLPHPSVFACHYCGKQAQCYEHREYTRPNDVKPACQSCNVRLGSASVDHKVVFLHIESVLCFYSYQPLDGGKQSAYKFSRRGWKKFSDEAA